MAEYDFNEKGGEFLEAFVDPGPGFDPEQGPPDIWFRRVLDHAAEFVIAFKHDGTVVYASDSVHFLLGHEPTEFVGTSALDLLHPDDLANAAETIYHAAEVEGWRPPRPFRLRHADGSFATYEVEGMSLFHVPEVQSIVCIGRYAESSARVDAIVGLLAANAALPEILDQVVHVMARPGWHFGVAIQYEDAAGQLTVTHTGLADALVPVDRHDLTTPWARACEAGQPIYDLGLSTIGPQLRAHAEQARFQTCWAIPVPDPGRQDACVVVWNHELHPPELGQEILLKKLRQLLELSLAGRARSTLLEAAASTDSLSGLANRRSFEKALSTDEAGAVALLFIDLDGFKTVNDVLGHAAGDEVIRQVGPRILAAVRHGDVAARLGGDEFGILCRDVRSDDDVVRLAERLLDTVSEPVDLPSGRAEFGLSIGIAIAGPGSHPDLDQLLGVADKQLYEAKQSGRGRYRVADVV